MSFGYVLATCGSQECGATFQDEKKFHQGFMRCSHFGLICVHHETASGCEVPQSLTTGESELREPMREGCLWRNVLVGGVLKEEEDFRRKRRRKRCRWSVLV